jgi:hypothetical protein
MITVECKECGTKHNAFNREEVKSDCKGCKLAKAREYFEDRWNNGGGFISGLCNVITKADCENLRKLHKAYPELVEGYISYGMGQTWEEFNHVKTN